jgi:hypothetical protein
LLRLDGWLAMREYEFQVTIVAAVRVRAENQSQAREAVASSSATGSPSTDEIRLANQAAVVMGKEATIVAVDFSVDKDSVRLIAVDTEH